MASDTVTQQLTDSRIMTFHPTRDEFKDFSRYIAYMESQGAHKGGMAKVIPPKDWKPRRTYDDIDDLVIPAPIQQVVTGQSGLFTQYNIQKKPMTVQEFRKTANTDKFCNPRYVDFEELERKFWKNLTFNPPLYGADVNGTLYDPDVTEWNIGCLNTILDTVEKESGIKIKGVNTPYLYFGMWKSTFAWHTEDMDLYSINYLHFGEPKSWYVVPPEHGKRLERLAKGFFPGSAQSCEAFLRHKMTLISPSILKKYGIPFEKITQEAGEFVVTFPFGYHAGFNHGFNCAESTNFATQRWIDYGKVATLCSCRKDMVKISMDVFVRKFQPDRYKAWKAGKDNSPIDHSKPTPEASEFLKGDETREPGKEDPSPSEVPDQEVFTTDTSLQEENSSPKPKLCKKRQRGGVLEVAEDRDTERAEEEEEEAVVEQKKPKLSKEDEGSAAHTLAHKEPKPKNIKNEQTDPLLNAKTNRNTNASRKLALQMKANNSLKCNPVKSRPQTDKPSTQPAVEAPCPLAVEAPCPLAVETSSPLAVETSSPLAVETPSPLAVEAPSPLAVEAPSPLAVEAPSPLAVETSSPLAVETPSPLAVEAPSPLAVEAPSPLAVEASSPLAVEASSPLAVEASSPLAVEASSPLAVEAPSPLAVEAPSPLAVEAPSPLAVEAPSPLAVEAPSPLPVEAPSPLAVEATSPLAVEATSPLAVDATSPLAVDATSSSKTAGPSEEVKPHTPARSTSPAQRLFQRTLSPADVLHVHSYAKGDYSEGETKESQEERRSESSDSEGEEQDDSSKGAEEGGEDDGVPSKLGKLPHHHPLLKDSLSDEELPEQSPVEEDGLEGESWAKPLTQLWQNRPPNLKREKEHNLRMGLQAPYCSVCLLFQTYQRTECADDSVNPPVVLPGGRLRTKPLIPEMCFTTTSEPEEGADKQQAGAQAPTTPHLEPDGTSLLISCSNCSVRVHTSCYGVDPESVTKDWTCARCKANAMNESCCLCSLRGGALQKANNNKWVHVLCAVAVLEARFVNINERSPVDLSGIPLQRFKLKCYYCKKRMKKTSGCCVQCSHGRCPTAYHPTCAQAAGVLMQPDEWPFVVYVTCCRHKGPIQTERNKAAMHELIVGQRVICKHKNGRYYQCDVVQLSKETFYEVNFDDGSFSDNLFPQDIVGRDCVQLGPPPHGDVVQVRWTDGLVYGAKFVAAHDIQMYQVEFEDGSQLTAKRDDVYTLDEELPKRVKSRLSKASDMRFDGIFEDKEAIQQSKRQRVINSRYRGDYIEPVIYRAIME
ncbi:lysine-specific demethylase 4A [Esox lucius]|uniref:[histone H3]-trimethyl-L-lysine(9) demethylase n=1 Tax=Esox lucius TaxID=8010 RepID=A0A6Q2Y1D2_ESOLU|nr:lysine-specific demethylase 4A [Esox lucius]